jgi:hypothetical protein
VTSRALSLVAALAVVALWPEWHPRAGVSIRDFASILNFDLVP